MDRIASAYQCSSPCALFEASELCQSCRKELRLSSLRKKWPAERLRALVTGRFSRSPWRPLAMINDGGTFSRGRMVGPIFPVDEDRYNLKFHFSQKRLAANTATVFSAMSEENSNPVSADFNSQSDLDVETKTVKLDLNFPRRRLQVSFTCNACGARSQRLINPNAYARGTVFVQCAGCEVYHKLVDNLGLIEEYDFRESTDTARGGESNLDSSVVDGITEKLSILEEGDDTILEE